MRPSSVQFILVTPSQLLSKAVVSKVCGRQGRSNLFET